MQRRLLLFLSIVLSFWLVACGSLPLPEDFDQPANPSEPEFPEPKPEPEPEPGPESPAQPGTSVVPELEEVLRLVNEARARGATCGGERFGKVAPLTLEPRLTRAAQKHSEDMAATGKMQHDTPSGALHYRAGSSPWDRIGAEGYNLGAGGENVARGQKDAEAVMDSWLKSPGHCRNIMSEKPTEIGLGLEQNFWTQVFASPL